LLTYLFLRGEVRSRTAALIGALVFAFGGYLAAILYWAGNLESAAWLIGRGSAPPGDEA
jgi:hypothetical protein